MKHIKLLLTWSCLLLIPHSNLCASEEFVQVEAPRGTDIDIQTGRLVDATWGSKEPTHFQQARGDLTNWLGRTWNYFRDTGKDISKRTADASQRVSQLLDTDRTKAINKVKRSEYYDPSDETVNRLLKYLLDKLDNEDDKQAYFDHAKRMIQNTTNAYIKRLKDLSFLNLSSDELQKPIEYLEFDINRVLENFNKHIADKIETEEDQESETEEDQESETELDLPLESSSWPEEDAVATQPIQ